MKCRIKWEHLDRVVPMDINNEDLVQMIIRKCRIKGTSGAITGSAVQVNIWCK
jgi:hypothetical protein